MTVYELDEIELTTLEKRIMEMVENLANSRYGPAKIRDILAIAGYSGDEKRTAMCSLQKKGLLMCTRPKKKKVIKWQKE